MGSSPIGDIDGIYGRTRVAPGTPRPVTAPLSTLETQLGRAEYESKRTGEPVAG